MDELKLVLPFYLVNKLNKYVIQCILELNGFDLTQFIIKEVDKDQLTVKYTQLLDNYKMPH